MSPCAKRAVHGPKDVTPSEELVAIAAASAAAAAAHTTQMSQGSHGHLGQTTGQLAQQPGMVSLQQEPQPQRDSPARARPGQAEAEALNRLSRLQQSQPPQVRAGTLSCHKCFMPRLRLP